MEDVIKAQPPLPAPPTKSGEVIDEARRGQGMVNGNGAQQETNGILCRVHGSGTTALLRGYTIRMEEDSLHQRHRHQ